MDVNSILIILVLILLIDRFFPRIRKVTKTSLDFKKLIHVSPEEENVLKKVELNKKKDVLHYLRTLEASPETQNYLASNPNLLLAVKKFLENKWLDV